MSGKANVLIVDDVKEMRSLLSRVVTLEGLAPVEAHSCQSMLARIKAADTKFALVLLDIELADQSGISALQQAKVVCPDFDAKVCFISGHKDEKSILEAVRAGGADYVVKPIDILKLRAKIQRLLGKDNQSQFAAVPAQLKLVIPGLPESVSGSRVISLSESGFTMTTMLDFAVGDRFDCRLPGLEALVGKEIPITARVLSRAEDKVANAQLQTEYFAMHEDVIRKIRAIVVKGKAVTDGLVTP